MNEVERFSRAPLTALLLALALAPGCGDDTKNGVETDTETNWLETCQTDSECGDYSCECGVCTLRCDTASECAMAGAVCRFAGEGAHDALCGEGSGSDGLCLDPAREPSDDEGTDDDDTARPAPSEEPPPEEPEPSTPDTASGGAPNLPPVPGDAGPSVAPETEAGVTDAPDASSGVRDAGPARDASWGPSPDASPCRTAGDASDCEPSSDLVTGYVLWDRPGGAAGLGPALELLEDGTLRLWTAAPALEPRATADWEFETMITPAQVDEIVRLLLATDYDDLPHATTLLECYPSLYFEGPAGELVELDYGGAADLLPEMQGAYDWFDALLEAVAPEFVGPSTYCAVPR